MFCIYIQKKERDGIILHIFSLHLVLSPEKITSIFGNLVRICNVDQMFMDCGRNHFICFEFLFLISL